MPSLADEENEAISAQDMRIAESESSPVACQHSDLRKVTTPDTCLLSEESFLQDYWGE